MAIGEVLTLRKTETNIPWHIGLGAMQHLTPATARIMLAQPWYTWAAAGIPTLEITRVPVAGGVTRAIWSGGIADIAGIGAECDGTIVATTRNITREGALSSNCKTQTIAASVVGDCQVNGLFMQDGNNFVMRFYTSENGDIWVSPMYGSGSNENKNAQTCLSVDYTRLYNMARYTNSSTVNNQVQPVNDKQLYINGAASINFACTDIARRYYKICSFNFNTSCNVYVTAAGINKHLSGDESENIETLAPKKDEEIPAVDRQTTLYLKCDVMQRSNDPTAAPEKIKSVSIEFVVQYKTNSGEAIGTGNPRTGVVGIVTNTLDSQLFNIWYKQPNDTAKRCKVYKMYVDTGNGRHEVDPKTWTFTSADRLGIYKTEVYKDNNIFYGNIRTNMLIFANEAAAEGYINKDYDPTTGKLPAPILDGDRTYSPDLPTGDKLTYNGIQTMPTGGLSECWLLDAAGLEQLASIFKTGLTIEENEEFGFFETTLLSTVRGLSMYNSPIDMIVDMFWIPIDISDYCNLGSETQFTVNGEEYAGEYGLSSAYSWVKQRQGDALDMTGRIGNAIGESFAVKTQQDPTNE